MSDLKLMLSEVLDGYVLDIKKDTQDINSLQSNIEELHHQIDDLRFSRASKARLIKMILNTDKLMSKLSYDELLEYKQIVQAYEDIT